MNSSIRVGRDGSGRVAVGVRTRLTRVGQPPMKIVQGAMVLGATNPNFTVPSGMDPSTASLALITAANNWYASYSGGAPSEHAYDSLTATFQTAWNADPIVSGAGGNALLQVDGGYGPNTMAAMTAVLGSAPAVNTAPAPSGSTPVVTPATPAAPSSVNVFAGMPTWGAWVLGAAVLGGSALVANAVWKKHGGAVRGHASRLHGRLRHHARRLTRRPA